MDDAIDRGECPRCGSHEVVHIIFGLVGPRAFDHVPEWVRFAGCVVQDHNRTCEICGHAWYDDQPTPAWHATMPEA
jgi:hypothetical protein